MSCYLGEESQQFWSLGVEGRLGGVETLPNSQARRVEPRFESRNSNNSLVTGFIGGTVTLDCSIFMIQVQKIFIHNTGTEDIFS